MSAAAHPLRRFTVASYLVGLLFLVTPFVDVFTNSMPVNPGDMEWRFGFFGVAANYLISPLFGLALLSGLAALNGHRAVLLAAAAAAAATGAFLLVGALLYGLDVLQLQNNVRPEAEFLFRVGSMKSFFKLITTGVVLVVLALADWRAARDLKGADPAAARLVR